MNYVDRSINFGQFNTSRRVNLDYNHRNKMSWKDSSLTGRLRNGVNQFKFGAWSLYFDSLTE